MNELEGRIGIVTGTGSGIGYVIANVLAKSDAVVYAINRTGAVKEGLPPSAGDIIRVKGDVTNTGEVNASISSIAADNGLDFIVNNARITKKHRARQFPIEELRGITEVNVISLFTLSQICYPYLTESRFKGRIINISNMAAHLGSIEVVPYCVSKAAVRGLTRGLAVEWANDNICVNSITPGWLPSEMNKQIITPERKTAILAHMPVHAFSDPRDLDEMAKFLLGDHARYITGQDFAVDGGALAYGYWIKGGRWEHSTPRRPLPITILRIIPC